MVEKKKHTNQAGPFEVREENSRAKIGFIHEKLYEGGTPTKTRIRKSLSKQEIVIKIIDYLIRAP